MSGAAAQPRRHDVDARWRRGFRRGLVGGLQERNRWDGWAQLRISSGMGYMMDAIRARARRRRAAGGELVKRCGCNQPGGRDVGTKQQY